MTRAQGSTRQTNTPVLKVIKIERTERFSHEGEGCFASFAQTKRQASLANNNKSRQIRGLLGKTAGSLSGTAESEIETGKGMNAETNSKRSDKKLGA